MTTHPLDTVKGARKQTDVKKDLGLASVEYWQGELEEPRKEWGQIVLLAEAGAERQGPQKRFWDTGRQWESKEEPEECGGTQR